MKHFINLSIVRQGLLYIAQTVLGLQFCLSLPSVGTVAVHCTFQSYSQVKSNAFLRRGPSSVCDDPLFRQ